MNYLKNQKGFGATIEIIFVALVLAAIAYALVASNQAKSGSPKASPTPAPKASATPSPSPTVVSLNETYNQYTSSAGVTVTYSKNVAATASCKGTAPTIEPTAVSVPVRLYEDQSQHKLFVAASKHDVTITHQISPGTYQGFDSCVVHDTNVADLEHPIDKTSANDWLTAVEFDYAQVENATELDAFVAAHAPGGITIDHSVAPAKDGSEYSYSMQDEHGMITASGPKPGPTSWYFVKYNPTTKLAVFWVTPDAQDVGWEDVDSAGKYAVIDPPVADVK